MLREWIDIIHLFLKKGYTVLHENINGERIKHVWCSYVLFLFVSIIMVYLLPKGFSQSFLDYATGICSIFVGFFITVLVFVDDKLVLRKKPTKEEENTKPADQRLTEIQKIKITQEYNYTIRFFYTLGMNILFSAIVLMALLPNVLWVDIFSLDLSKITIISSLSQLSWNSFLLGIYFWSMVMYRIIVLYFLLKIFFYTTYATSSLVSVLILKREEQS